MYKVAITICVGKEKLKTLQNIVEQISCVFAKAKSTYTYIIIFSIDDYTPINSQNNVKKLATKHKNVISNYIEIKLKGQTFARTYLAGFERAIVEGADCIVEMDAGTHDPKIVMKFVEGIYKEKNDCVFSTRFTKGGGFINMPMQRIFISKIGTILTNVGYGIYPFLSDMTSGYEAFSTKFIKKLFTKTNINIWASVTTVPHLIQTELRVLSIKLGVKYKFIPIKYGSNSKGKKLKLIYVYKAIKGYLMSIFLYYKGGYWKK